MSHNPHNPILSVPLQIHTVFVALADRQDAALVTFYRQLFGEPTTAIPNLYAEFQLPGLKLGIFQPKASHQEEFDRCSSGSMSLCIEVEQLETAIEHLRCLGFPPPGEIMIASHGREIYAYDPAGNRLILHEAKQSLTGEKAIEK